MTDQTAGRIEFGPQREPVGAGDGNTYVVRECGRCSEVHTEIARLQANVDRLSANPADHRYWEARYRDEAAENERLRKALIESAAQFRRYEAIHAAKGPEHAGKARRNRELAEMCEAALYPQADGESGA
ncbi:MAG: hypothetical protein RLO01_12080 [Thalassobaculaceae bacterium]